SNTAGYGAAIDNDDSRSLTVIDSYLAYNLSYYDGGAIDVDTDGVQFYLGDTFANNYSPFGSGGAVWNDTNLTIQDSVFYDNLAGELTGTVTDTTSFGGAIFHSSGRLTLTNSTLYQNTAGEGGGLYSDDPVTVLNTTFYSNTARKPASGDNLFGG